MLLSRVFACLACIVVALTCVSSSPRPQQGQQPALFELPVQLVGFPVIIAAVRVTNFVKKLAYSLNPATYRSSRVRRGLSRIPDDEIFNMEEIEKKLVNEFGNQVCVYERVCAKYAEKALQKRRERAIDMSNVLSHYKSSPVQMKDNYLLSVFMGDIIGSPRLCHLLAKRGRGCSYPLSD